MARAPRTHCPGVLHYVVLRAAPGVSIENNSNTRDPGQGLFRDDDERHELLNRLSRASAATGVSIHGFCLTSVDIRLLLEPAAVPLGDCVRYLCGYFAHWLNKRRGTNGHVFHHRYRVVGVTDRRLVRSIVRHLHRTPVAARLTRDWEAYGWSSARCYLGSNPMPWVITQRILLLFGRDPSSARVALRQHISLRKERQREPEYLRSAAPNDFCAGDSCFLRWLSAQMQAKAAPVTLEQLVNETCRRMGVGRRQLVSSSRVRYLSLARAVVTWYATQFGIATYPQVARYLHRDPSTLFSGTRLNRRLRPELFELTLEGYLQGAGQGFRGKMHPVLPDSGQGSVHSRDG